VSADEPGVLEKATEALRRGEVIAFPTDTVYGIGAHAFRPDAVARLYVVKDRPFHVPIPLLLDEAASMEQVCLDIPPAAWLLADRFWPGGLSLILKRGPIVPDVVTAGGSTLAIRVPDQPLVRALCRKLGAPLAATSANLHGQPDPVTADDVESALRGRLPLIVDGGRCPGGLASTILDLSLWPPVLRRAGPISAGQLTDVVPVVIDSVSSKQAAASGCVAMAPPHTNPISGDEG
jgi:L-threonylcarbamoyladenylate synthase